VNVVEAFEYYLAFAVVLNDESDYNAITDATTDIIRLQVVPIGYDFENEADRHKHFDDTKFHVEILKNLINAERIILEHLNLPLDSTLREHRKSVAEYIDKMEEGLKEMQRCDDALAETSLKLHRKNYQFFIAKAYEEIKSILK
jgi:hypothetical protein